MLRSPFEPFLRETGAVVLDGGFATELEAAGKDISDHLWSARVLAEDPNAVRDVHLSYYRAGADVATTASYQASFSGFEKAGYNREQTIHFLRQSIALACQARDTFWSEYEASSSKGSEADDISRSPGASHGPQTLKRRLKPLVAFSCGPYGASLADGSEYNGSYADHVTEEQLMDFHRSRIQAVQHDAGLDLLAFETIPCLAEARAITRLLRTEGFGIPAWISFSCRDESSISHGESFANEAVPLAGEADAVVGVGLNCTAPRFVTPLLKAAQATLPPGRVLVAYPNAGEEWCAGTEPGTVRGWKGATGLSASAFGEAAVTWAEAGARCIGGCCRTTPEYIQSVADHLR